MNYLKLNCRGYRFSWSDSSWSVGAFDPASNDPHLAYLPKLGDEKQIYRLIPSSGKYLGITLVPVEVSGIIPGNLWPWREIGSGAPIGAFMRELEYTKIEQNEIEKVCSCSSRTLFNQGCCC
jgi:hypothetical protein